MQEKKALYLTSRKTATAYMTYERVKRSKSKDIEHTTMKDKKKRSHQTRKKTGY